MEVTIIVRFQLNLADKNQSYKKEIDADSMTRPFIGKNVGEEIEGDFFGFEGYKMKITGGSDRAGFPMSPSLVGGATKRILFGHKAPGYKPNRKGKRRRKRVRGNVITEDIYQINLHILEKGKKPIEELL